MASQPAPRHPVAQMQGAFEESMRETLDEQSSTAKNPYLNADKVRRRKLLLESPKYERTVGGKWMQKSGENFHPLWKLVAQISFGMHLLQSGMAQSDQMVIELLQRHVDEVDGFLERTTEDFELAQHDIHERIKYLRLPLEHGDVFDGMLADRDFRTAIVDGNEKIEHIVNRTTVAMKDALKDVQKGLDGTRELARFMKDLNKRWSQKSEEHDAVYSAMMGNTEGWDAAFKAIQAKGSELGLSLVQLGGVISEIQRRAGIASRRNLPSPKSSSSRHSQKNSPPAQHSGPPSASRTAARQLTPLMSPIHEQEPSLQESSPKKVPSDKPIEISKLWVAELPAQSESNRKSIHALMTAEAMSAKSSTPASQTSVPPLPTASDKKEEEEEEEEEREEQKASSDEGAPTPAKSETSLESTSSNEDATPGENGLGSLSEEVEKAFEALEETENEEALPEDSASAQNEEGMINPFTSPEDDEEKGLSVQKRASSDFTKSPQLGLTFYTASSDADTGSIDARSTPGKGRSRSTTHSQQHHPITSQINHQPTDSTLLDRHDDDNAVDFAEDEEGVVNHKHPIFQDVRGRNTLSQEVQGLSSRVSNESLSSAARKNSFRESDSSIKPASKSQSGSPVDSSNRASDNTMATPLSLSRGGGEGAKTNGWTGSSGNSSRPRTQVGHAPPIAPAPIQTQGFDTVDEPPSPSLAELTSATVSGPDMGDPFAPYTRSTVDKPKHKHQELMDRITGALQESSNREPVSLASNKTSSPIKASQGDSKNPKQSIDIRPQAEEQQQQQQQQPQEQQQSQPQQQSPYQTSTTNVTTTSVFDSSRPTSVYNPTVVTSTTGGNSVTHTTTTTTLPPPSTTASRPRTLSPFKASGFRQPDRTPEGVLSTNLAPEAQTIYYSPSKKSLRKFFSMKRGKKGAHENF